MAKKVKIDAWQKFQNPLLTQYNVEQLTELKRSNWNGLLLGIDQLYSTMFHEWDALQKDVNDIADAVRTLEWTVVPYMRDGEEADERAQEVAKVVREALWRRTSAPLGGFSHSFLQLVSSLVHAVFRGYNVHEIEWANDGELVYPARYIQLPPQFLMWETRPGMPDRLLLVPDGQSAVGVPFSQDMYVVALNNNGPDHPVYNATFYSLVNWFLAYKFGLAWYMEFTQKFGMPKQVFRYHSAKDKEQLIAEMEDERVINSLFVKGDRNYEIINPPAGGASIPQAVLIQKAEDACHKAILGQTLTSDTSVNGGSLAQARVHAGVRAEVVMQKAEFVAEVLNQQLIPAIVRANFGRVEGMPLPELRCKLPKAQANMEQAQAWQAVLQLPGMRVKKSDVYESLGVAMPGEADEVFETPQQGHGHGAAGMFGGLFGGGGGAGAETDAVGDAMAEDGEDDDDPEPPGGGDGVKARRRKQVRDERVDAAQAWLAPLKAKLRAAQERGASFADLREEVKSWKLNTLALAQSMADNVKNGLLGAKREEVRAANPYGCNQYGEGWAEEHNGNSTKYEVTGFSGKQSKMLTHEADGNKVSVATKDKKPGKDAYPDASNAGLEKAAEGGMTAHDKKLMQGVAAFEGILNGSKKVLETYGDKDGQLAILDMQDEIKVLKKKIEAAETSKDKQKYYAQLQDYLTENTKKIDELLKSAPKKKAEKQSAVKLQQDFTAKKGEVLTGLEDGIKKVEEALAEAKKQGDAFGEQHLPTVLAGLKHWMEAVKQNNEVTADNFAKLKAHGEMATKLLRKADSDIKIIQEGYTGTLGKPETKKPDDIPAPKKKDDLPAPKKKDDLPGGAKGYGKGIKAALIDMPESSGPAINHLIEEVETTGDKAAAKVWGKLPELERNAVVYYTGSGYVNINKSFREGEPNLAAKRVAKALSKMELGMDVRVTRAENEQGLEGILPDDKKGLLHNGKAGMQALANWINEQAESGKKLERPNKAPMSTSLAKGAFFHKKIVRVIDLPKGTKGGCIANYSHVKGEREFLVAPGTKTRIISAEVDEKGTLFIREEVVRDEA